MREIIKLILFITIWVSFTSYWYLSAQKDNRKYIAWIIEMLAVILAFMI